MKSQTTPEDPKTLSVKELAQAARPDRNRAIDLYRAVAMAAVAIGHWLVIHATSTADGIEAGNALEFAPGMSPLTWIFQVMPLFFVVGGFSSAMSLDSFARSKGRPCDWIVARLRRMVAPAVLLAGTWFALIAVGSLFGAGPLLALGAGAAAIPLWFLANYTIDTALAPYVLPRFRKSPGRVAFAGLTLFGLIEALRFAGVPVIPQINWVLGWMLFQVLGFAWRDGLLPTGRRLVVVAAGFWAAAIAAVAFGPWPTAMVHFPGLENSPTHPPSLALMLFGAAYSFTAIAAAPAVSGWLARSPRVWAGVVGANAIAMSVYLWHFTAMVAAVVILAPMGLLPTASAGTAAWWWQKAPLIALAAVLLALIVPVVAKTEQRALLAPRRPWEFRPVLLIPTVIVLSTALKLWANGSPSLTVGGLSVVLAIWFGVLKGKSTTAVAAVETAQAGR